LRKRDLNELLGSVQDFARRQPTAFLGATVLVGFAAMRFLKSATSQSSGGSDSWQPERGNSAQAGMPGGQRSYSSPASSSMYQERRM
jgi:hypothetical protein